MVEQSAVNRSVVGSSPTRGANFIWPVGQAVKTPPFHGGIPGSIPGRVTTWTIRSAGRAPALQAGCRQFDPVIVHQRKRLSSDGRFLLYNTIAIYISIVISIYIKIVIYLENISYRHKNRHRKKSTTVAVVLFVFNAART